MSQTRLSEQGVLHQSTLLRHFEITINISTRIPLATTLCDAFLGVLHLDVSLLLYVHPFLTSMSGVTTFCAYTPSLQVLHVPRPAVRTPLPHKYDKCHSLLYIHPFLTNASHLEQHKTPHQAFAQPGIKGDARSAESPIQPDPNDRYEYDSGA